MSTEDPIPGILRFSQAVSLQPLVFHTAQVAGAVKAAAGEAPASALTGTDSCANSGNPESPLFFDNDDQLRWDV